MTYKIHFDGACDNRGFEKKGHRNMGMGIACFINDEYDDELSIAIGIKAGQEGTSMVAEWEACLRAFKLAKGIKKADPQSRIYVYGDSEVVTKQFNGSYQITKEQFLSYYKQSREYGKLANCQSVIWIPREQNKKADELSKMGLDSLL